MTVVLPKITARAHLANIVVSERDSAFAHVLYTAGQLWLNIGVNCRWLCHCLCPCLCLCLCQRPDITIVSSLWARCCRCCCFFYSNIEENKKKLAINPVEHIFAITVICFIWASLCVFCAYSINTLVSFYRYCASYRVVVFLINVFIIYDIYSTAVAPPPKWLVRAAWGHRSRRVNRQPGCPDPKTMRPAVNWPRRRTMQCSGCWVESVRWVKFQVYAIKPI